MTNLNQHWNHIFSTKADSELGWYESDTSQTFRFLDPLFQKTAATVFLPGAGTSALVGQLLDRGHNLILNDISDEALTQLKQTIDVKGERIIWLHSDVSKTLPLEIPQVDFWIDRAVLHFLLDETDIKNYFTNVQSMVKTGGYVLLAEFSHEGAAKCAGLDLHRYSVEEMTERIGIGFELIKYEDYLYTTPFGATRPYIYALYKKIT